ncbi:HAMP domain-containing protein [Gloeobacter morelensis MG652769]|uniref:histidine kinase n=1 Tax=Gloeobacter morelensis MG652769 TaxID=2781736 RepID=A0ABY3PSV0_9CYAN|nr:HAMP domain-containing protein [Gloeobacter morelensis MG652769]
MGAGRFSAWDKQLNPSVARLWRRTFGGVRTRILAWYVLLIALCGVTSVLAVREILFMQLQERLETSLVREVRLFQLLSAEEPVVQEQPMRERAAHIFDRFFYRYVPHDNEFMLAYIDGELYRTMPQKLDGTMRANGKLTSRWSHLRTPERDERIGSSGEKFLYIAEPLRLGGEPRGLLVAAYCVSCERREVERSVIVVAQVFIGATLLASLLAWIAAGRVLAPLRLLAETARSIGESDLTRRIPAGDRGELGELAATFNQMLDRLEAAFASQRNFISDAGHELRTPITIVRGHLELLGDDPDERAETMAIVYDELDRMNRFVDDLLLLARAERPDFLFFELFDVGELTDELYAKARALAPREWSIEARGSGRMVADRQRLTQAVINLAQNAVQHTGPGDRIAIGSALRGAWVYLWVSDCGPGIAPEDQRRIFERFERGSHSRYEGSGLGLAIVQAIATTHGGSIQLTSTPGAGATFTLVLPLDPPQELQLHNQLTGQSCSTVLSVYSH